MPAGVYLSGNLQLANNTALFLQGGAVIRCTGNPRDYTTNSPLLGSLGNRKVPGTWLLYATNGVNIKLYGRGTIDGNGHYMALSNHFGDNLLMLNCTNFTAEGITFRDAGGWDSQRISHSQTSKSLTISAWLKTIAWTLLTQKM
jgi:polygalacturonase